MKAILFTFFLILAVPMHVSGNETPAHNYVPKDGYVPDERTAIKIAEAVLSAIYGAETIEREKPLKVSLRDDKWTVSGSLSRDLMGGVALIEISKKDGRIVRVTHSK